MPKLIAPGPSSAGWHRVSSILTCPTLFIREAQGIPGEDEGSDALVRGSIWHVGMAHHYAQFIGNSAEFLKPMEAIDAYVDQHNDAQHRKWGGVCQAALDGYARKWRQDQFRWQVIEIEKEVRLRINDPDTDDSYLFTQRPDMIVFDKVTQLYYIIDHKGAYTTAPRTIRRYTLSGQFAGYHMIGAIKFGEKYGGVIVNLAKIPDPAKSKEGPDFVRPALEPAPGVQRHIKQTIIHAYRMEKYYAETYGDPDNYPGVFQAGGPCYASYGPCKYHNFCRFRGEVDNAVTEV